MPQIAGRKVAQIVGPSRRAVKGRWVVVYTPGSIHTQPSHLSHGGYDSFVLYLETLPASDIQGDKITRTDDAYVHDVAFTRRVGD